MNNRSPEQALRMKLLDIHSGLDVKTYAKTDGFWHKQDWRLALTINGKVVADLTTVDRAWYRAKCTNKEQREERDEWVNRIAGTISVRKAGAK